MASKTIILRGDPPQFEATAGGTITPGYLIYHSAATTVAVHANAGQDAAAMFAIENSLEGDEIGDNYSTGEIVQYVHCRPGDEIYAVLATDENASVWSELESAGNGQLRVHTAPASNSDGAFDEGGESIYTRAVVARALEAVDLSSSGGTTSRIKVRIV